ncbi:RAMP superfamily CRISPR-associated protein [Vibrio chaetopteri]|uniref:RAMP superfamily CRISPR-associated protein n=1 Tax=Vibrio chaetopteri TaxID=3016528 RepID=UPI003AB8E018
MRLIYNMQSYWLAGTGTDAGAYADNLAIKTPNRLPYLPARTQKGQLREAFELAEKNSWFEDFSLTFQGQNLTDLLFGTESRNGQHGAGVLLLSNAVLSDNEQRFFVSASDTENNTRTNALYDILTSTAIDDSGSAKMHSLRTYEVVIPVTLYAQLELQLHYLPPKIAHYIEQHIEKWLTLVLPLVTHIGAKKQRGLGEVIITLDAQTEAAV